jgi:hypothetical protein
VTQTVPSATVGVAVGKREGKAVGFIVGKATFCPIVGGTV